MIINYLLIHIWLKLFFYSCFISYLGTHSYLGRLFIGKMYDILINRNLLHTVTMRYARNIIVEQELFHGSP